MVEQEEYARMLPARLDELDRVWARYQQDVTNKAPLAELHRLTHLLTDPGESLYYQEVAGAARKLEQLLLNSLLGPEEALAHTFRDHVQLLLDQMRQHTHQSRRIQIPDPSTEPVMATPQPPDAPDSTIVFIVEHNTDEAMELADQLELFGYEVRVFAEPAGLSAAVVAEAPAAILTNIVFPGGELAGATAITAVQQLEKAPPVLFVSDRGDLEARLEAVRAGASAYLTKPVDVSVLIDKLDRLTGRRGEDAVRVLVIEDDQIMAEYYRLILGQAGMLSHLILDPLQLHEQLAYFSPDLILMDLYMPGCDGLELAAVLRHQEAYHDIPIVFLSQEKNIDRQMKALAQGAEAFLTKPVEPHHLIMSIQNRVRRARILRSLVSSDSLTGLLNHSNLKKQLDAELTKTARRQGSLSVAMIDLDHFKQINDEHGHLMGDRVLRSVSMLLRQRLRPTDIVGRYGGEEFVAVLPHTTGPEAVELMDTVRTSVSQLRFRGEDGEFNSTFSAGVACFPEHEATDALLDAADKALYAAKEQGRDRVLLSE